MSLIEETELGFTPLSPRLGAELAPIDLRAMTQPQVSALEQLAAERCIVVARDQAMTLEEQVEFARRLGPLTTYPARHADVPSELLMIYADENSRSAAGRKWHSDISSERTPPGLSMLRMETVPDAGGDTLFCDMYQAFEKLSPEMQSLMLRLTARHDPVGHHLYLSGEKTLKELPSQVHPVVRTHPLTGRRALYVNSGFTARIPELSRNESRAILDMLFDHIASGIDFQVRVSWQPGTVVFWDNRCVQHHAAFDYFPQVRRGYRATVIGEQPFLDA